VDEKKFFHSNTATKLREQGRQITQQRARCLVSKKYSASQKWSFDRTPTLSKELTIAVSSDASPTIAFILKPESYFASLTVAIVLGIDSEMSCAF